MDRVLQDRYEDFWNRKGACVAIEAPKADFTPKHARDVEQKWQDSSFILENFLRRISATGFYGDGFPSLFVNHGPGVLAAFLGNPYQLADDTVWFDTDPMIKDMEHPPPLSFNMKNPVYHLIHTMTEQYLSQSGGRYITLSLIHISVWQMFAWGMMGLLSGLLSGILRKNRYICVAYGILWGFLFGWIMNLWAFTGGLEMTAASYIAYCITSIPHDAAHAIANAVLLFALGKQFLKILDRVAVKYGLTTIKTGIR